MIICWQPTVQYIGVGLGVARNVISIRKAVRYLDATPIAYMVSPNQLTIRTLPEEIVFQDVQSVR